MTKEQLDAFQWAVGWVAFGTVILSFIVWFIFMGYQNTERERLKHASCMVVTYTNGTTANPSVTVTEYCGPKKETP